MGQSIELPVELYEALQRAAQASGVSLAEWIASKLPSDIPSCESSLKELLDGLIGVIDSREQINGVFPRTALGDLIALKMEKQGLSRPE